MTMPHLMNCGHSDEGWCLDCVKAMHDALSKKPHDGGPAFPTPSGYARVKRYQPGHGEYEQAVEVCKTGMTLRDYFAAKAMPEIYRHQMEVFGPQRIRALMDGAEPVADDDLDWAAHVARDAYKLADAMLAERAKGGAA